MDVVARIMVENYWPQIAPLLDRLEAELAKFQRGDDPISRARRILGRRGGASVPANDDDLRPRLAA
jgi:hypothetical protein